MTTFNFHHHDFGDHGEGSPSSVWVAAYVNSDHDKGIGAYVDAKGVVTLDDYIAWSIDQDLRAMGIDPDSDEGEALVDEWSNTAREYGLGLLNETK